MIGPETMQAAVEATKTSSYFTGQFVIDGALLIAGLKVVEAVVSKVRKRNGTGVKPGEGPTCRDHGESIAALEEFKKTAGPALLRIDGKLDRLIERFIGKP